MGFKSVNEIEKFKFTDCVITKREKKNDEISYEVEALIIASDNSQNSNCTESYAGTAYIRFISGEEILCIKDGYKKYDCDNKLIEEVPDEKVDSVTMENLLKHCENFYLSGIEKIPDGEDYVLFMDKPEEEQYDTLPTDTYQVRIKCEKVVVTWERYLNRVQS